MKSKSSPPFPPEPQDLLPELKATLFDVPGIGPCLQHPLVYAVPYFEVLNANYNCTVLIKQKEVDQAVEEVNFGRAIWLHERPFRIHAFNMLSIRMSDEVYWELLGEIWSDTKNYWQNKSLWNKLLMAKRPHREKFMDEEERVAWKRLPESVTVYRGHSSKNKQGISYTLNHDIAVWFAKRFSQRGNGQVATRDVRKSEIFALLLGRKEEEILILPKRKK